MITENIAKIGYKTFLRKMSQKIRRKSKRSSIMKINLSKPIFQKMKKKIPKMKFFPQSMESISQIISLKKRITRNYFDNFTKKNERFFLEN